VAAHHVRDMHNPAMLALLGALGAIALATAGSAQESDPMCQAMMVIARAANADAGTWLDRSTRNEGVEVSCPTRVVQFKRFSTLPQGAQNKDWRDRLQQEWNRNYCNDYAWRPAIDAGWKLRLSLITRAGERAEIIATCR
jgi:hypothetical protein